MKGKIVFTCFDEINKELLDKYDIKLHITRYINKGIYRDCIHVPQLAPSESLFSVTMKRWKKLNFTKDELDIIKNGETGTWFDLYKEAFIKEMNTRIDFKKNYNRLKEHLDNGKNIIAICYCSDYKRCHRYLIHQALLEDGYNSECL